MSSYYRKPAKRKSVLKELKILIAPIILFWTIEIVDYTVFRGSLDQYGIKPRDTAALGGIFLAPFLHGGFGHLMANTIPFITLGWLTMLQETNDFYIVSAMSAVVGGTGVWLFGAPNSVHIGASILIYGYLGFLLLRGCFQRNLPSITLSILVVIVYGGLIWGVFPSEIGVSWQGHLFGFLGGAIAAKILAQSRKTF
jgi:membrane associated rhomboid family serine protease